MSNVCVWLAYCYFMFFADVEMKNSKFEKILNAFKVVGIIAGAIWSMICIVKEVASIPWVEWAENGVLEHLKGVAEGIILFPCWLFVMWILHRLAMFGLHKLWPETFDEYGHMRK